MPGGTEERRGSRLKMGTKREILILGENLLEGVLLKTRGWKMPNLYNERKPYENDKCLDRNEGDSLQSGAGKD